MRTGLAIVLIGLAALTAFAQPPSLSRWLEIKTGILPIDPTVLHDARSGRTYVLGRFDEQLSVNGVHRESYGGIDGFVLAVDDLFNVEWLMTFGGVGWDQPVDGVVTQDGSIVVASFCASNTSTLTSYQIGDVTLGGRGNADAVVFRLNMDGTVRWARNDGGFSYEVPISIVELGNGRIVVNGFAEPPTRIGPAVFEELPSGYLHVLSADGNHLRVGTATPIDSSASAEMQAITNIGDDTFTVPFLPSGRLYWSDMPFADGTLIYLDLDEDLTATRSGLIDSCRTEWMWSAALGSSAGAAFPNAACQPLDPTNLVYRPSITAPTMIIGERDRGSASLLDLAHSVSQVYLSGFVDGWLDLIDTPPSPDVRAADTTKRLGFVAAASPDGTGRWVIGFDDNASTAVAHAVAATRSGCVALVTANDTIRSLQPPVPVEFGDLILMSFIDPAVSVREADSHTRHPESRSGEGPLRIYDLTGRLLGTVAAPVHSDALRARLLEYSGPLVLRQGTRVSLCHVFGPHHIAFALPAGTPR